MRERTLQPAHLDASESDLAEQSVPELVALLYHLALLEFEIRILGLESVELLQNAVVVERVNLELLPVIASESVKRRGNDRREETYDCSTTALWSSPSSSSSQADNSRSLVRSSRSSLSNAACRACCSGMIVSKVVASSTALSYQRSQVSTEDEGRERTRDERCTVPPSCLPSPR